MMWARGAYKPDKSFSIISGLLILFGLVVFSSAAFGLLARGESAGLENGFFSQFVLGLGGGLVLGYIAYRIDINKIRPLSLWLFIASVGITLLVFVPHFGLEWGGAKRWILLGPISFQPAELLKLSTVLLYASWMAGIGKDIKTIRYGVATFLGLLAVAILPLIFQPDNGTAIILIVTSIIMFFSANGKIKHLLTLGLILILLAGVVTLSRPYVMDRILSYLNIVEDPLGVDYQAKQSLMAIGSGEIFGRGWGQSLQKFQYLPEPVGDSIFAVLGEEFGLMGTTIVVVLFVLLGLRGLRIASRSPNNYMRYLVIGLTMLIVSQTFLNVSAMLGVLPLTGVPLAFMSHGGSALMFSLISIGLILNISRYQKD